MKILLFAFAATLAVAQPKLTLTVHTGHGQVGYDVNSTMISGQKDMIVIDPQFSLSEAHKLAAEILESKKNLATIYITHPHPDHLFGLAVLKQAFPEAKIVALPRAQLRAPRPAGPRARSSGCRPMATISLVPIRSSRKNSRSPI